MGAEKWWTSVRLCFLNDAAMSKLKLTIEQIIHNCFRKVLQPGQEMPADLAPKLLHRFWNNEGYTLFPDVQPLLSTLRNHYKANNGRMVVGVITNSDNRVPDVLSSLGLRVSPLRYGSVATSDQSPASAYDVDFTVMSYDVGYEKPDRRIFEAAEEILAVSLQGDSSAEKPDNASEWQKVYVGDEYSKDVVGAVGAGWNAVLINRDDAAKKDDIEWLDNHPPRGFEGMFASSQAVGFSSLAKLAA